MSEESRQPCAGCGRPTLAATGGFCRRCRPGQPAPPPETSFSTAALPTWSDGTSSENLVPVFIPALAVLLLNLEKQKGSPLIEREVLEIRDKAVVMMIERSRAEEFAALRGYPRHRPRGVLGSMARVPPSRSRSR